MSTNTQTEYIAALIDLHRGRARQGPGDSDFSRHILNHLPTLPLQPRIADVGCGSGAGALLLAQHYQSTVVAVDSSAVFIDELRARAKQLGIDRLIVPIQGDMAQLDRSVGVFDLLCGLRERFIILGSSRVLNSGDRCLLRGVLPLYLS